MTLLDGNLNFQVQSLDTQFTLAVTLVHLDRSNYNVDYHRRYRRAAEDPVGKFIFFFFFFIKKSS